MGIRMGRFQLNCPLKVLPSLLESGVFLVRVLTFVEASQPLQVLLPCTEVIWTLADKPYLLVPSN
jgi:hypothetical protein